MWLLQLDQKITNVLYLEDATRLSQLVAFSVASVPVYLVPVILLVLFMRSYNDRRVAVKITVAAVLAWQVFSSGIGSVLYQTLGFRDRPFAQQGFAEFLFEQPQKAFPSDHAAVLAVVALGLCYFRYGRLARLALFLAIISSIARVVIGFHWFGDVAAGWVIGAAALGVVVLFQRTIDQYWTAFERLWKRN